MLSLYDDLLRYGAFLAGGNEEIDTVCLVFHVIKVCVGTVATERLKLVDECALHVVHSHVDFAGEVLKVELHLSVIGVGDNVEINGR